jgi:hypothetical protein
MDGAPQSIDGKGSSLRWTLTPDAKALVRRRCPGGVRQARLPAAPAEFMRMRYHAPGRCTLRKKPMTNAFFKYVLAFVVTAIVVKALSRPAVRVGLVDRPGGRKRHDAPVPVVGGPAMFAGFVFASLSLLESLYAYRVLFVAMALLVVVGALDDARDLKPSSKSAA